jgi:hypothetical protein
MVHVEELGFLHICHFVAVVPLVWYMACHLGSNGPEFGQIG